MSDELLGGAALDCGCRFAIHEGVPSLDDVCQQFRLAKSAYNPSENPKARPNSKV